MKKHIGLGTLGIFLGCLMTLTAFGQDRALKRVKKKTENGLIEYHVLKSEKDVMHGPFEKTEFSHLVQKGSYFEGKKDGEWLYYDLGKLDRSILYDKGKEISNSVYLVDFKKTYENSKVGTIAYSEVYNGDTVATGFYAKNEKTGKWTYYMPWGKMAENNYKNGKKEGKETFWYKGSLIAEKEYAYGLLNGSHTTYWTESSQIKHKYTYLKGIKSGAFLSYYKNGQLGLKGTYKHGDLHGEILGYYKNGQQRMQLNMDRGTLNGPFNVYFSNGQLMMTGHFENGNLMTVQQSFDFQGQSIHKGEWSDGMGQISIYGFGDTLGVKLSFKMGKLHGKQLVYGKNGSLEEELQFVDGEPKGVQIEYDDGYFQSRGNVENGYRIGTWKYDEQSKIIFEEYTLSDSISFDNNLASTFTDALFPPDRLFSNFWTSNTFTVVEEMPQFRGGQSAMVKFLRGYVVYPELEMMTKIEGISYVQFVVNPLGAIEDIRIYPGMERHGTQSMHKESMRVISLMPRWQPGFQNGIPVKVSYSLPVRFKLR